MRKWTVLMLERQFTLHINWSPSREHSEVGTSPESNIATLTTCSSNSAAMLWNIPAYFLSMASQPVSLQQFPFRNFCSDWHCSPYKRKQLFRLLLKRHSISLNDILSLTNNQRNNLMIAPQTNCCHELMMYSSQHNEILPLKLSLEFYHLNDNFRKEKLLTILLRNSVTDFLINIAGALNVAY